MANKTRLDSLTVGERFKFSTGPYAPIYVFNGTDAFGEMKYTGPSGQQYASRWGGTYVVPLDPPPPVPER